MWPCAFRNSAACCWCCSLNVFLIAWNSTAVNDGVHCKSNVINVHVGLTHWVPVWPDLNPARVFNPVTWFYIDSEIGSLLLCAWCGSTVLCCVCLYVCVCVCLFHKHNFGTLSAIFSQVFKHVTYSRGLVELFHCWDMLCTFGLWVTSCLQMMTSNKHLPSLLWHCWLGVRKSIWPGKIEWLGVGVVICLERGADCLHMIQLMPLHHKTSSSLASFKSRLVLPFWYQRTQIVLEKRSLNKRNSRLGISNTEKVGAYTQIDPPGATLDRGRSLSSTVALLSIVIRLVMCHLLCCRLCWSWTMLRCRRAAS